MVAMGSWRDLWASPSGSCLAVPPNPCPPSLGHRLSSMMAQRSCATVKQGQCPQPYWGLRLAVPACKATRNSGNENGHQHPLLVVLAMPVPILLQGQAVAPGRCAQPWRIPAVTGWHQMKTNGLGDTSASINGSAVSGMLGTCQHRQEEQQHWGQHPTWEPWGHRGSAGSALGFHILSSAQSPPGAVAKRSWMGSSPGSTALPCPHHSEPLTPAPPLFWGCTQQPPLLVLTHPSGGSGIPELYMAFPALEGLSQHWKGCSAHAVLVPQLSRG